MTKTEELVRLSTARRAARSGSGRRIRVAAGLSQAELAEGCGVTPPTISRWEAGDRQPRGEPARRYAELLEALARSTARARRAANGEDDS